MAITRSTTGSGYAIPTENEWYKAAYYKGGNSGNLNAGYWLYATQSNTAPDNSLANAATDPNDANYYTTSYTDPVHYLTAVGTFVASPSAYGTFDQSGNVFQWNETAVVANLDRGLRGGSYADVGTSLQSSTSFYQIPTWYNHYIGFGVVQVPEPASLGILGFGVIGMLMGRRVARK
jgi:formylglycine-generating enzyme required for sulfatase activity